MFRRYTATAELKCSICYESFTYGMDDGTKLSLLVYSRTARRGRLTLGRYKSGRWIKTILGIFMTN